MQRKGMVQKDSQADSYFEEKTTGEYGDNQFWNSSPDEHDLDDLMADMLN